MVSLALVRVALLHKHPHNLDKNMKLVYKRENTPEVLCKPKWHSGTLAHPIDCSTEEDSSELRSA